MAGILLTFKCLFKMSHLQRGLSNLIDMKKSLLTPSHNAFIELSVCDTLGFHSH